jgi:hypothetical protein
MRRVMIGQVVGGSQMSTAMSLDVGAITLLLRAVHSAVDRRSNRLRSAAPPTVCKSRRVSDAGHWPHDRTDRWRAATASVGIGGMFHARCRTPGASPCSSPSACAAATPRWSDRPCSGSRRGGLRLVRSNAG